MSLNECNARNNSKCKGGHNDSNYNDVNDAERIKLSVMIMRIMMMMMMVVVSEEINNHSNKIKSK